MTELILSLGSNQGDRYHYLQSAVSYIRDALAVADVRVSSFVETEAWGGVSQAPFLNAVMVCDTLFSSRKCSRPPDAIFSAKTRDRAIMDHICRTITRYIQI